MIERLCSGTMAQGQSSQIGRFRTVRENALPISL